MEPKDRFVLEAAMGWLMLGNPAEALKEFEMASGAIQESSEGLMILWDIQARSGNWAGAVATSDRLIQAGDGPDGYIKRAYALHELKRTQEAWETLQPVSDRFKSNWLISYNLSCYASQLGQATEALKWFRRALRNGNKRELKQMALSDPDLAPIRTKIKDLTK